MAKVKVKGKFVDSYRIERRESDTALTATMAIEDVRGGMKYAGVRLTLHWTGAWELEAVQDINESFGASRERPLVAGHLAIGRIEVAAGAGEGAW